MGEPMDMSPHPELKYYIEHLDFMLRETRKELDNARAHANVKYMLQGLNWKIPRRF